MSKMRFFALQELANRKPVEVTLPSDKLNDYYGIHVFDQQKMQEFLPKEAYKAVQDAIEKGKPISIDTADLIANGMKSWAKQLNVTHYTHWFQPLTDGTAEKHDGFIDFDEDGDVIERFSGKLLIQQEPDASSFPNGGIRNTFEARGYTAWDVSSPAFVVDDTLCIPTIFISYTGEALDYKTPLLKALAAVDKAATAVCQLFDERVKRVHANLGWEQEYFLVDRALYDARPDLCLTGRTLMGHSSAKDQQLDDHYFGSIPARVTAFMKELEIECYKLGIPLKTRHNEVAPNQFELAPIFENVNLANDHNQIVMDLMKRIAEKHKFAVLLHEKPFSSVNGSGKHNNWSLGTDTGVGLLTPGKTPAENLQFVTFMVNILMAVYKNNALLKASVMTAQNAHRLGANEAPPAIISAFLGTQLSQLLDKIENSNSEDGITLDDKKKMQLGIGSIPEVFVDNTDRNRTSPFAFTGNRFEFRAVGSSANCASAMIALNTVVAAQLKEFKAEVDKKINSGIAKEKAIFEVIKEYIKISKPIRFDGNGYSDEWKAEAAKRGLDCETSVPKIYDAYTTPESVKLFTSTGVFSEKELAARNEVKWDTYTKKIQIEARVLGDMIISSVIPVATKYQSILLDSVTKMENVFGRDKALKLSEKTLQTIEQISEHISILETSVEAMVNARKVANKIESEKDKAIAYHDTVLPYFDTIRYHADKLELLVDDEMWPLPKYRELLFIR